MKKINEVLNIAFKAHKAIGCKSVTRSDFKFYNNKFYLLEINTQPGMTSLSLVPEIARYNNISFLNLIEWIIKDASTKDKKIYFIPFLTLILLSSVNNRNLSKKSSFRFKIIKVLV